MTKFEQGNKLDYSLDVIEAVSDLIKACKKEELAEDTLAYTGLLISDYVESARSALEALRA